MTRKFSKVKKADCAHGHSHASGREARRCNDLHLLERAGEIVGLTISPKLYFEIRGVPVKFPNGRRVGYTADFGYVERGVKVIEESKPERKEARSRDYALRIAIARALYPTLEFREVA